MAEKNDKWYNELYKAVDMLPYSDKEIEEYYPELWAWYNSPMSHSQRAKSLEKLLSNDKFRSEIMDITLDGKFDELLDSNKGDENAEVLGIDKTPIEDVNAWYDAAKKSIDPTNVLKNTELYDTAGDKTFFQLEDMNGDLDWFAKLAKDLGYPDTYEGYNQLEHDFKTVLNRKRNADNAEKYPTPVKFAFGKSFDVMEDGKKPSAGDVASDTFANFMWAIPGTSLIKGASALPKVGKGIEAMSVARSTPGQVGNFMLQNSIVPTANEIVDNAIGTDTESEKKAGLRGRAENAGINSAINMVTPGIVKMMPTRTSGMFGGFGMDPTKYKNANNVLADFVDFGNKQEAAKRSLRLMDENKKDALEVISLWSKRFGDDANKAVTPKNLGEFKADLPGRLKDNGEAFINSVERNGLYDGARELIGQYSNPTKIAEFSKLANDPKSIVEEISPYASSYIINRLGTNAVGDFIRSRLGRNTRYWKQDEESK